MIQARKRQTENREILKQSLSAVVLLLCASGSALAGVEVTPSVRTFAEWDSNPLMRVRDVRSLYGAVVEPRFAVEATGERSSVAFDATARRGAYNQTAFDTTDLHGNLNALRRAQRVTVSLGLSGDYDTTRTSEATMTGLETGRVRHWGASASPEIGYALSPIERVKLGFRYEASGYDKDTYRDYHRMTVTPSFTRMFTPLVTGSVYLNAQRYQTDEGPKRVVDTVGPSVGAKVDLTRKTVLDVRVGTQWSKDTVADRVVQDWAWGLTFSGGLTFKGEADSLTLEARRSQQAYAAGGEAPLTRFSAQYGHAVHERLSLSVDGSFQMADAGGDFGDVDRAIAGGVGLQYKATEALGLSASYRHRNETRVGESETARQHMAIVGANLRF